MKMISFHICYYEIIDSKKYKLKLVKKQCHRQCEIHKFLSVFEKHSNVSKYLSSSERRFHNFRAANLEVRSPIELERR